MLMNFGSQTFQKNFSITKFSKLFLDICAFAQGCNACYNFDIPSSPCFD